MNMENTCSHGVYFLVGESDNNNVSKETNNVILGSGKRLKEKQNEDDMPHTPSFLSSFVPQHCMEDPPGVRDCAGHGGVIRD